MTTDTTPVNIPELDSSTYKEISISNMAHGDLVNYLFGSVSIEEQTKLSQVPLDKLQKLAQEKRDQAKK